MTFEQLEPVIGLRGKGGAGIGYDRIRLLEAIDAYGSLSAAARNVGLTYKAVWDAVAAINNLAERPLVVGRIGGRAGGGASLTEDGRRFLRSVQFMQYELRRLAQRLGPEFGKDIVLPALSWRFLMRTSARNMLLCKVAEVKRGAVNAEIILDVSDDLRLVAIITEESVKTLELKRGMEVFALIKSSFVLLAPEGEIGRISARNIFSGTVARREDGAVNSEIILDIGSGKTLAAIITMESARSLDFKVGDRASALIKASHIILAIA
jgi:molybdate transport system regulatory protein